jgi:hypothetical protein
MRSLVLASGLLTALATVVQAKPCPTPLACLVGAPAPSIGTGVPVALAAAAVLCGTMLVRFLRRS